LATKTVTFEAAAGMVKFEVVIVKAFTPFWPEEPAAPAAPATPGTWTTMV
jgi:hypothetical protein